MEELFKVLVTFSNGHQHVDTDWTSDMEVIKSSLIRLIRGPGRLLIKEILVVDSCDCTVFLHRDGKQVWPAVA